MAFLSAGHRPSEGPYGEVLDRAVDYALRCQRADGLLSARPPVQPVTKWYEPTHTATYNHAFTGLMLGEVYGSGPVQRSQRVANAIEKAIQLTRQLQIRSHRSPIDSGGWRYLQPVNDPGAESDLSATGCQILFLRSAANAGFDIPQEHVDEAVDYVKRSFNRDRQEFFYSIGSGHRYATRTVTGAGLLCLYLSGKTDAEIERAAGEWIVSQSFRPYNKPMNNEIDRYHYGAFYCSQAIFQLGGDYWAKFYRHISAVLLESQHADGSWDAESCDPMFGNVYSSALAVLILTPPYQLLPIYQR